jgi:outer membrane protein OmpA-like peptidoglycan-associated protein
MIKVNSVNSIRGPDMRHSASFCLLAFAAIMFAQQAVAQSQLFFYSTYDRYSLKAKDKLEADKDGSGYTLGISGSMAIAQGFLLGGLGLRKAEAQGENYDRSQEVQVSDALLRLGYVHPIPGLESFLQAGLVSDISRGKGANLGYEGAESQQTVIRLAPLVQLQLPLGKSWKPYLEGSYAFDLNGKAQRETKSSFGLGVMLALDQDARPESTPAPAEPAPPPPPPPPPPLAATEDQQLALSNSALIFPLGKTELHTSLKSYLSGLVQILKEQSTSWSKLSIIGYSESTEMQLHGKEIAEKRAQSVKDFLKAEDIEGDRLTLAEPGPEASETMSRQRVDIHLFGQSLEQLQAIQTELSKKRDSSTISLRLEILTMDKAKVDVGSEGRIFLQKLGRILKSHEDQWQTISVMGYADGVGKPENNRRVAVERAERQAAILIGEGLAPDRVKSLGISTAVLLDKNNPTSRWNRRAEIEINGVADLATLKAKIDEATGNTRSIP